MKKATLTTQKKEPTKQTGFTLIELALVLIVMTIIAAFTTKAYLFQKAFERKEARADKTIQEIIQIGEAAGAWRLDKGDWPDVANHCTLAIAKLTNRYRTTPYLRNIILRYPHYYYTSCNANNFYIEVTSNKDHYDAAKYIRTKLANTTIINPAHGDTTITSIPLNTINPTLADFLPLTGGVMTGDFDMGVNKITSVADIELNGQSIKLGMDKYVFMDRIRFLKSLSNSVVFPPIRKPECDQGGIIGHPRIITFVHQAFGSVQPSIPSSNVVHWSIEFLDDPADNNYWKLVTVGIKNVIGIAQIFCEYPGWGGSDK